jgi:hypothetical protein
MSTSQQSQSEYHESDDYGDHNIHIPGSWYEAIDEEGEDDDDEYVPDEDDEENDQGEDDDFMSEQFSFSSTMDEPVLTQLPRR